MDYSSSHSIQLTIQQLSEKLDIPKPTLRFWEKELEGIIVPLRTSGGQRRYTEEHIPILEEIKRMRSMGKSIIEIKNSLCDGYEQSINISDHPDVDLLSERIAEVVRIEINKFLKLK